MQATQADWHNLVTVWSRVGPPEFLLPQGLQDVQADVARRVCSMLVAAEAFPPLTDVSDVV
eukprot:3499761-Alexandrium_andersonii.AAC.1